MQMQIACHPVRDVSEKIKGAERLAAGPFCKAPGRIGPDAPLPRWNLLDRSDHRGPGSRIDYRGCVMSKTCFQHGREDTRRIDRIAIAIDTPFRTGVAPVLHSAMTKGYCPRSHQGQRKAKSPVRTQGSLGDAGGDRLEDAHAREIEQPGGQAAGRDNRDAAARRRAVQPGALQPNDGGGMGRRRLGVAFDSRGGGRPAAPQGVVSMPANRLRYQLVCSACHSPVEAGPPLARYSALSNTAARHHVVHGEPGRRRRRDGPEALARAEARHVADQLGDMPEIPDVPVRLATRVTEVHFHHVEHRRFLTWDVAPSCHSPPLGFPGDVASPYDEGIAFVMPRGEAVRPRLGSAIADLSANATADPSRWTHRVGVTGSALRQTPPPGNAIGLSSVGGCLILANGELSPWPSVLPPLAEGIAFGRGRNNVAHRLTPGTHGEMALGVPCASTCRARPYRCRTTS